MEEIDRSLEDMKKLEFIDICKRMVMQYCNRYVHSDNTVNTITVKDVNLIDYRNCNGLKTAVLTTDISNTTEYIITFEELTHTIYSKINKKDGDNYEEGVSI